MAPDRAFGVDFFVKGNGRRFGIRLRAQFFPGHGTKPLRSRLLEANDPAGNVPARAIISVFSPGQ
ncbi:MAG: hypothetical protein BWY59_00684 [Verrucomicrobia bacterium ADurb.Bin345]|nr:MAG: hypothetical protein BWY59_00684 [Verrucomicrobia bacterium ADurb.Bin345]